MFTLFSSKFIQETVYQISSALLETFLSLFFWTLYIVLSCTSLYVLFSHHEQKLARKQKSVLSSFSKMQYNATEYSAE